MFFGEAHLRQTLSEFAAHYHRERNHQGLYNRLIAPETLGPPDAHIRCRMRLGGLLRYYPERPDGSAEFSDSTGLDGYTPGDTGRTGGDARGRMLQNSRQFAAVVVYLLLVEVTKRQLVRRLRL